LPADRPRLSHPSQRGGRERLQLSSQILQRLRALARAEGATLYMLLLAAFQLQLSKYSGSDDIVGGTPTAGPTSRTLGSAIGFFANTLVMRTDLSGDPTFRALLQRVRDVALDAYEHQDVPLEQVVAELQPDRSSHAPLFQVMFGVGVHSLFDLPERES